MNGIFHPCAQKIYSYGDFKKPKSLLIQKIRTGIKHRLRMFKEVCDRIEFYRELVQGTKANANKCLELYYQSFKQGRLREHFKSIENLEKHLNGQLKT